jgi:hypothetical protein
VMLRFSQGVLSPQGAQLLAHAYLDYLAFCATKKTALRLESSNFFTLCDHLTPPKG